MEINQKRILVVDDEFDLCEILKYNLSNEGYYIEIAHSAEEALKRSLRTFDLILLDIMLGPMSGLLLAEIIRQEMKLFVPIIFLSAKNTEDDILKGFRLEADDYITKPFSLNELFVRIRAVLSRYPAKNYSFNGMLKIGNIEIDTIHSRLVINDEYEELTKKECEILKLILANPGKVLSREAILAKVWGKNVKVRFRSVDVHITRLRNKLGDFGSCLRNKTGSGYYFEL